MVCFIISILNIVFALAYLLLLVRAALPWIKHDRDNPWLKPVYQYTDTILHIFRLGLPPQKLGTDFSVMVVILLLFVLQRSINFIFGCL